MKVLVHLSALTRMQVTIEMDVLEGTDLDQLARNWNHKHPAGDLVTSLPLISYEFPQAAHFLGTTSHRPSRRIVMTEQQDISDGT